MRPKISAILVWISRASGLAVGAAAMTLVAALAAPALLGLVLVGALASLMLKWSQR